MHTERANTCHHDKIVLDQLTLDSKCIDFRTKPSASTHTTQKTISSATRILDFDVITLIRFLVRITPAVGIRIKCKSIPVYQCTGRDVQESVTFWYWYPLKLDDALHWFHWNWARWQQARTRKQSSWNTTNEITLSILWFFYCGCRKSRNFNSSIQIAIR